MEEKKKIKILFYNKDAAGVNYFRTLTPAIELENNHSDEFEIEINPAIDLTTKEGIEYLKNFDIIHYHRQLINLNHHALNLKKELTDAGVTLIMDIDDYWYLDYSHPMYFQSLEEDLPNKILRNLVFADYITTTTELFANEIRKITKKDNVIVLYNSINPDRMTQFTNNHKADPNGLVRINYTAGSSHLPDIEQLYGVINVLDNNIDTQNKFKILVSGWDTKGNATDLEINHEFVDVLKNLNLFNQKIINKINNNRGDLSKISEIPEPIRMKYGNAFHAKNRKINANESVYFQYEKILTYNHQLIKDPEYYKWLMKFERSNYDNENNFARRWTKKPNEYAIVLDETDISIAPLADNMFNRMKSNLKQVECWSRKIPVICSDIPPYNVDGKHMKNCILIPNKKNAGKYWQKAFKKLILEPNLREDLGSQLYEDFHVKYHLSTVTKTRAEFYKSIKR